MKYNWKALKINGEEKSKAVINTKKYYSFCLNATLKDVKNVVDVGDYIIYCLFFKFYLILCSCYEAFFLVDATTAVYENTVKQMLFFGLTRD